MTPHNYSLKTGFLALIALCGLMGASAARAEAPGPTVPATPGQAPATTTAKPEEPAFDFEHEDAYMDVPDALRSKQFVHRAILSTIVRDTAKVSLGRPYFQNLLGFNAVYQPADRGGKSFAKYVTGAMSVGLGYSSESGHSIEVGAEFSGVSTVSLAYRFWMNSEKYTVWPTIGIGAGTEVSMLRLSDVPVEAQVYQGNTTMGFLILGAVVPVVDLAIKLEARLNFFGLDRLMLTTGAGLIFFI